MSNQVLHALYDDDDVLLNAVKEVREQKHHIEEIYTPFPCKKKLFNLLKGFIG